MILTKGLWPSVSHSKRLSTWCPLKQEENPWNLYTCDFSLLLNQALVEGTLEQSKAISRQLGSAGASTGYRTEELMFFNRAN